MVDYKVGAAKCHAALMRLRMRSTQQKVQPNDGEREISENIRTPGFSSV